MIKSIIFDMDGTLFSTEPIYFECYQAAAKPMGLDFTFELFESCIGVSAADSAPLMKSYFGRDVDVQALHDGCCRNFEEYMQNNPIPFRPCAKETVKYFYDRGFKLGVGTSNIRRWAETLLEKNGIAQYFTTVVTADDVAHPKPDPEVFLRCAQNLGTDISQCIVFEDSVAGATAAISARARAIVIPDLKEPTTFVKENAFKIYKSMCDIYPDIDELLA